MTPPLAAILGARIAAHGPITVAEYMDACLLHPQHGYYTTREPFGAAGDFTTAPEIHQMFGELCGLALAQAWQDQGRPAGTLVEIGPGRGTLMADMRRAMARVPGLTEAMTVALVEASPRLRAAQTARLGPVRHLARIEDAPDAPLFLIANELLDALPVRQFQRTPEGWAERMIAVRDGALAFALAPPVPAPWAGPVGTVVERRPAAPPLVAAVAARLAARGGAALWIDYGGWAGTGDTLQALRGHAPEGPLAHPGAADLTAHVDFAPLAAAAQAAGCAWGLRAQGPWLRDLGAAARAQRLAAAGDAHAAVALRRLTAPDEMGQLFKVLALWPPGAPPVPGFEAMRADADDA